MISASTFSRTFYRLFTILCLCHILLFLGCSDEPDQTLEPNEVMAEKAIDEDPEVTRRGLSEQAFRALQQQFESPILDEGFETLHRISSSSTYLDFLRDIYPEVPHQDFKTFVAASIEKHPPNAELYSIILKKHFGRAREEDLIITHRMHQAFQRARILIYHGADQDTAEEEILLPALRGDPIFEWLIKRFKRLRNDDILDAFGKNFEQLSQDVEFLNIERINKALKDRRTEQRPDDGFIWLMLREPVMMGEILESFTDTEIFLKWLKGEFKEPEIRF